MKLLEINSKDLEYNIEKILTKAGESKVIAVVKGNGYGLGLKEFAEFLVNHGINYLAVSSVEEAVELANMNLDAKILCMEATSVEEEIAVLLDNEIIITIGNYNSAVILNRLAKEKNVKAVAHFKIDTGFSRYGFCYKDKENIYKAISESTSILVEGVYSHFSSAYFSDQKYTDLQLSRFIDIKKYLEEKNVEIPMYHIANSSAFLTRNDVLFDAVRIGSAFLGRVSVKNTIELKRIGMLKSNVVELKEVDVGTPVGYSNSVITKKKTKLAIVPIGYADGFNVEIANDTFKFVDKLRILKNNVKALFKDNRIYVMINDTKYPVIGRVGMNHIAVDVSDSNVKINDEVKIDMSPILVSSKIRREYM